MRPTTRPGSSGSCLRLVLFALALVALAPRSAGALEAWDGRLQMHGYGEVQLRWISDGFDANNWYHSQWANILNLEIDADLAPDGWGPFDLVSAFARIEVRYDCIYTGCGIGGSHRYFGDRADRAPARNWRDAKTNDIVGYEVGADPDPREYIHEGSSDLLTFEASPLLDAIVDLGGTGIDETLAPVADDLFAFKSVDGTQQSENAPLGPWNPGTIRPLGSLREVPNPTLGLPMRPTVTPVDSPNDRIASGLYVPSAPLVERLDDFDSFDQNFSQEELEWNHGAGQDEGELKELYVDLEMFDSRLWIRLGKQNIVWGKTELFRTTDQMNPQDLGLSSIPTLEESRLALWSARAVWSFWNVGPLQDVRAEIAVNYDDFEPNDFGRCGEPYAAWLVCQKSAGLWAHGVFGLGLAGEVRPPDPWDSTRGLEVGGRIEWRWDRFSFALTNFWGYSDMPSVEAFNIYERRVDSATGRPLDSEGRPLTPGTALTHHPGNRQLFDVICNATKGAAGDLLPGLDDACLLDLLNNPTSLTTAVGIDITPAEALSVVLGGSPFADVITGALTGGSVPTDAFAPLSLDPGDSGATVHIPIGLGTDVPGISGFLNPRQQALLGCGPFYNTVCDRDGLDLFNAEASTLLQAFPFVEDMPVGTLPGGGVIPGVNDGTPPAGFPFDTEMEAVSNNFLNLLVGLGISSGDDPDCTFSNPQGCSTVRGILAVTSAQRPELRAGGNGRFGRRDFYWHAGGEALIRYNKRNVLGASMDFAEDVTKTNWSFEFTWIDDELFASNSARDHLTESDAFNLTISVDRPTFVRFLNTNRTFFFNAQLFLGYLSDYNESYRMDGPLNVLWTFAVSTGYFQDRLLPSMVWIHHLNTATGGFLPEVTWRATQSLSFTFGAAIFYGGPQYEETARYPLAPNSRRGGNYKGHFRYGGLSPLTERDEIFFRVRYTF